MALGISERVVTQKYGALRYSPKAPVRATVRRQYAAWRKAHGLPDRCDIPTCRFHHAPLRWNGAKLPLILDHIEGNKYENHPQYLRYLCPNCNSQQHTTGGKNRGRVTDLSEGGYVVHLSGDTRIVAATAQSVNLTSEQIARLRELVPETTPAIDAQQAAQGPASPPSAGTRPEPGR